MIGKVFFRLSLAYLIGGSIVIAFTAAPLIFQLAPNRNVSGAIAGAIINQYAWTAMFATGIAMISLHFLGVANHAAGQRIKWLWIVLSFSLTIQLISYTVLRPMMNDLIVLIGDFDLTAKDNPLRKQFGILHGISSLLFLIVLLLGIGAVVIESTITKNGNSTE